MRRAARRLEAYKSVDNGVRRTDGVCIEDMAFGKHSVTASRFFVML